MKIRYTILLLCLIVIINCEEIINLTDYNYPKADSTDGITRIAIMSTNDLHGSYFPQKRTIPSTKEEYEVGGLEYLGNFIEVMRAEWGEDFLYLDAGDHIQGSIEAKVSKGEIMTQYFNDLQADALTLGNHEWDFGKEYLDTRMADSNAPYLVCNINNGKSDIFLQNQRKSELFITSTGINIGVVGLTVEVSPTSTMADISYVKFKQYKESIEAEAQELRNKGAHVVILLAHLGLTCPEDFSPEKFILKMRNEKTPSRKCDMTSELPRLISDLTPGTIDAIIGGHQHEHNHDWINNIPIMSNIGYGESTSIMYLAFKPNEQGQWKFYPEDTQIESPIPVCAKIFKETKMCNLVPDNLEPTNNLKSFYFHGKVIKKESILETTTQEWVEAIDALKKDILATSTQDLILEYEKESIIGNLYTDLVRKITGAQVAILNPGSITGKWAKGNISKADVFAMSPYDNVITSVTMTGKELRKMLFEVQKGPKFFYPTSGVKQVASMVPQRHLVEVKLFDGRSDMTIVDEDNYTVATNDFCLPFGGDHFGKVLEWYTVKDLKKYSDLREYMFAYLKEMKEIKEEDHIDALNPRLRIITTTPTQ